MRCAVAAVSPVSITGLTPESAQAVDRRRAPTVARASATASSAAGRPVDGDVDDRAARRRERLGARRDHASSATPSVSQQPRVAHDHAPLAAPGDRAVAGHRRRTAVAAGTSGRGPWPRAGSPAPAGARSASRRRPRPRTSASSWPNAPRAVTLTTAGRPSVSVPVLSKTTVSRPAELLERHRVLEQDAALRAEARCRP